MTEFKELDVTICIVSNPEGEILSLKKSPNYRDHPRYQENPFETPGGKIEENESPEECAKRELNEETKIKASPAGFNPEDKFENFQEGKVIDFYPVPFNVGNANVRISEEHEDYQWFKPAKFKEKLPDHNVRALKKVESHLNFE